MIETTDAKIELGQLQIKLDNPRHSRKADVAAALKELVENERVVELAQDIAKIGGINPMDRIGVVRDAGSPDDYPIFVAAEGNRRVAALMLLDDPERMPPNIKQRAARVRRLRRASDDLGEIGTIRVVVFPTFDDVDPWIDRMHVASGAEGARKRWNATQQARRNGETSNVEAVELIAAARKAKIVTQEEADAIKPTNVTRIVSSAARRTQIGLIGAGTELRRTLPWDVFRIGLHKLMRDQVERLGEHNSRALHNAEKLRDYVGKIVREMGAPEPLPNGETRPLTQTKAERSGQGPSGQDDQGEDENANDDGDDDDMGSDRSNPGPSSSGADNGRGKGDNNAPRGGVVGKSDALERTITALENTSLSELYTSITTVSARQHAVLVCIGCSTLLELLFKAAGWDEKGKIVDRLMGLDEVKAKYGSRSLSSISDLLRGLRARANLAKHDSQTGGVHGDALIKDMATLNDVFLAVAEVAVARKRDQK